MAARARSSSSSSPAPASRKGWYVVGGVVVVGGLVTGLVLYRRKRAADAAAQAQALTVYPSLPLPTPVHPGPLVTLPPILTTADQTLYGGSVVTLPGGTKLALAADTVAHLETGGAARTLPAETIVALRANTNAVVQGQATAHRANGVTTLPDGTAVAPQSVGTGTIGITLPVGALLDDGTSVLLDSGVAGTLTSDTPVTVVTAIVPMGAGVVAPAAQAQAPTTTAGGGRYVAMGARAGG